MLHRQYQIDAEVYLNWHQGKFSRSYDFRGIFYFFFDLFLKLFWQWLNKEKVEGDKESTGSKEVKNKKTSCLLISKSKTTLRELVSLKRKRSEQVWSHFWFSKHFDFVSILVWKPYKEVFFFSFFSQNSTDFLFQIPLLTSFVVRGK